MEDKDLNQGHLMMIQKKLRDKVLEEAGLDPEKVELNLFLKKKKEIDGNSYMILFQNTEFLLSTVLKPGEYKMLGLIRALCQYENLIPYSQKQLGKLLGFGKTATYEALKALKEYGILVEFKDEKDERRKNLYLNPELAWKGKLQNKAKVMSVFSENSKFQEFKEVPKNKQQLDLFDSEYDTKTPRQKKALAAKKEDEWGRGVALPRGNPNDDSVEYHDKNGILVRRDEKEVLQQRNLFDSKKIDIVDVDSEEIIGSKDV